MKKHMQAKSSGFTLIELLVVVLIIGILSAIALPQYEKAVFKSRAAEAIQMLHSLENAYKVCKLEDDTCGANMTDNVFEQLSIEIPGEAGVQDCYADAEYCIGTKNWVYLHKGAGVFAAYLAASNPNFKLTIDSTDTVTCDDAIDSRGENLKSYVGMCKVLNL